MFKILLIKVDSVAQVMECKTLNQVKAAVGIRSGEDWETMELDELPMIGIIARDQDKKLKSNRLDIKGHFAFIGMQVDRQWDGKLFTFSSLTDEQISEIRTRLALTTYHNIMNQDWEAEV